MGMRIDVWALYHGCPMGDVRRVLREYAWRDRVDLEQIAELLDWSPGAASRLRAALRRDGYLECKRLAGKGARTKWGVTKLGRSLAYARGTKPIRRATADRLVAAVVERAAATHAADYPFAWRVGKLWVFGSYLTDRQELGDLDIAVERIPRFEDSDRQYEYVKERIRLAMRDGRVFGSIYREFSWPEVELERFLKRGSRAISLNDMHENREFLESVPRRQIFPAPTGGEISIPAVATGCAS